MAVGYTWNAGTWPLGSVPLAYHRMPHRPQRREHPRVACIEASAPSCAVAKRTRTSLRGFLPPIFALALLRRPSPDDATACAMSPSVSGAHVRLLRAPLCLRFIATAAHRDRLWFPYLSCAPAPSKRVPTVHVVRAEEPSVRPATPSGFGSLRRRHAPRSAGWAPAAFRIRRRDQVTGFAAQF